MITKNKLGIEVGRIYKPKKIKRLITEEQKNRVAHLDSRLQPDPNWKKVVSIELKIYRVAISKLMRKYSKKNARAYAHIMQDERHDIFNKYGVES